MNSPLIPIVCAVLAALSSPAVWAQNPPLSSPPPVSSPASTTHKPVLPLLPANLLGLLPQAPDKWELKKSQANNFVMDWASTVATREFNYTPPPTSLTVPGSVPPPMVLKITLTDTGYYEGLTGDFENLPTAKASTVQSFVLSGFPARQTTQGQIGERLRVLVNGRYIVQIEVQNQPANSSQKWLRIVDLAKIAALPTDGDETLPRPYTVIRIDELNAKNNSVSKVTFATQEEADETALRR